MELSYLPQDWKSATISPIYKGGVKHNPANYRPISLTCICCKVLERIIKRKVTYYLEAENLLDNNQHGFRTGRSCQTNLLLTLESWTRSIDDRVPVDAIYFDFSKAFDAVPHGRLLHKIRMYGIDGLL